MLFYTVKLALKTSILIKWQSQKKRKLKIIAL